MRCIIFDIDGTLFDASHRMHFITKNHAHKAVMDKASATLRAGQMSPQQFAGAAKTAEQMLDPDSWKPNWDAFFDACVDDKPISHIVSVCRAMHHVAQVIFVSGRSDRVRNETVHQLRKQGLLPSAGLYMRKHGDRRTDDVIKLEILGERRAKGYDVLMAFDDRDRVVKMWRANGVPCLQVAEGDF